MRKAPYTVIQRAMHIHPTVAEYLPTVFAKLAPFVGLAPRPGGRPAAGESATPRGGPHPGSRGGKPPGAKGGRLGGGGLALGFGRSPPLGRPQAGVIQPATSRPVILRSVLLLRPFRFPPSSTSLRGFRGWGVWASGAGRPSREIWGLPHLGLGAYRPPPKCIATSVETCSFTL